MHISPEQNSFIPEHKPKFYREVKSPCCENAAPKETMCNKGSIKLTKSLTFRKFELGELGEPVKNSTK